MRAVVIGSGPNGLAAAIELARAGLEVTVHEAAAQIGGGARSAELTLPGFVHDVCSAVHPMAIGSPCFERYPLHAHGLEWIQPEVPLAHPLDDGTAVLLERSLEATCANLGEDGEAWRRLLEPLAAAWPLLRHDLLAPPGFPRHPLLMARFGWDLIRPARALAESVFRGPRARALFAGVAAHSLLPLEARPSAGVGLILSVAALTGGWPIPRGGSQSISNALASYLRSEGGQIRCESRIDTLPDAPLVMCDVTPRQLLALAGPRFPEPVPPGARPLPLRPRRLQAGLGARRADTLDRARLPARRYGASRGHARRDRGVGSPPYRRSFRPARPAEPVRLQPRAPGQTYGLGLLSRPQRFHGRLRGCHRIADRALRSRLPIAYSGTPRFQPGRTQRYNPNLVGGDIGGGSMHLGQFFLRPNRWLYRTPLPNVFLCSSSTPPGGAVHGMCGYHAVISARKHASP